MEKNYQVIGQSDSENQFLAVGIMDTGSKEDLENSIIWYKDHFNYSLHVITQKDRLAADSFVQDYPQVTFIVFNQPPTLSERVNSLANTCLTSYFLLTRSDVELVELDWKTIDSLLKPQVHPVCITPLIFNKDKELVPTVKVPAFSKKDIVPLDCMPSHGNDMTLYPFLGMGVYDRALFQRLRGFDEALRGAYWQSLDFGTRSWLFGYPICSTNSMAFIFPKKQFLIENRSETKNAERFYTKALGVKLVRGHIAVKKSHKTDKSVLATEVKPRAGLYKTDFEHLVASWKLPEKK